MARQSSSRSGVAPSTVTAERAGRLYRLVALLAAGPQGRDLLRRRLGLDVRSFYRDLDLLRQSGIGVSLRERLYALDMTADDAYRLLPFPDPHLSLGDALSLAKGRTAAHRRLKALIGQIVTKRRPKKRS